MFTPEYIHVLTIHLPLVGLTAALIPLFIAVIKRSPAVLLTAFIMVFIFSVFIPVVMISGETAMERIESTTFSEMVDAEGKEWMQTHYERAEIAAKFVYLAIALSLLGLAAMRYHPEYMFRIAVVIIIDILLAVGLMIWAAEAGGKIRHPEFRDNVSFEEIITSTEE